MIIIRCKYGLMTTAASWVSFLNAVQIREIRRIGYLKVFLTHRWRQACRPWRWVWSLRSAGAWCGIGTTCSRLRERRRECAARQRATPCICHLRKNGCVRWSTNADQQTRVSFGSPFYSVTHHFQGKTRFKRLRIWKPKSAPSIFSFLSSNSGKNGRRWRLKRVGYPPPLERWNVDSLRLELGFYCSQEWILDWKKIYIY